MTETAPEMLETYANDVEASVLMYPGGRAIALLGEVTAFSARVMSEELRCGEITTEDVCTRLMGQYALVRSLLKGHPADNLIHRIGFDIGAYNGIDIERLYEIWQEEFARIDGIREKLITQTFVARLKSMYSPN